MTLWLALAVTVAQPLAALPPAPAWPGVAAPLDGENAGSVGRSRPGCLNALTRLLPVWQSARSRAVDVAAYDAAGARWHADRSRAAIERALRAGELATPEQLFALIDALNPDASATFRVLLDGLSAQGVRVILRNFRQPYGWSSRATVESGGGTPRAPAPRASRGWPWLRGTFPFVGRERRLTLYYPSIAPRTPSELAALIVQYSRAIVAYRLDLAARKSGLFSLPFSRIGFPQRALEILFDSERHLYASLTALRAVFPEVEPPLPERDRIWRWRYPQMGIELLGSLFYPSYVAFKKYDANKQHFDLYSPDGLALRAELGRKYRHRLQMQWAIDRWRNFIVGYLILGLGRQWQTIEEILDKGLLAAVTEKWEELRRRTDPARLNRALESYQSDPEGFDVVNDFYNEKIRVLRERIAREGDPKGKLQREIEQLEERRDLLKN